MINSDVYYIHQERRPTRNRYSIIYEFWNNYYINIFEGACLTLLSYNIFAITWAETYYLFYLFNIMANVLYLFSYYMFKYSSNNFSDVVNEDDYKCYIIILIIILIYFLILDMVLIVVGDLDDKLKINILDEYIFISMFGKFIVNFFYMYIIRKNRLNTINSQFYNVQMNNV